MEGFAWRLGELEKTARELSRRFSPMKREEQRSRETQQTSLLDSPLIELDGEYKQAPVQRCTSPVQSPAFSDKKQFTPRTNLPYSSPNTFSVRSSTGYADNVTNNVPYSSATSKPFESAGNNRLYSGNVSQDKRLYERRQISERTDQDFNARCEKQGRPVSSPCSRERSYDKTDVIPEPPLIEFPLIDLTFSDPKPHDNHSRTRCSVDSSVCDNTDNSSPNNAADDKSYGVHPQTDSGVKKGEYGSGEKAKCKPDDNVGNQDEEKPNKRWSKEADESVGGRTDGDGANEEAQRPSKTESAVAETRKLDLPGNGDASLSAVEKCRVCLRTDLAMWNLLEEEKGAPLSVMVMSIAEVEIAAGDGLPALVCNTCVEKLESAYQFKLLVEQTDSVLRGRSGATRKEEVGARCDLEVAKSIREMHRGDQEKSTCIVALQDCGTPPPLEEVRSNPPRSWRNQTPLGRTPLKRQGPPIPTPRTNIRINTRPKDKSIPSFLNTPYPSPIPRKVTKPIKSLLEVRFPKSYNPTVERREIRAAERSCRATRTQTRQRQAPRHGPHPTVVVRLQRRGEGTCWKCGDRGHTHRECASPKQWAYCYMCGEKDVKISTCSQCGEAWRRARRKRMRPPDSGSRWFRTRP